ncbi:MAG: hypothetical protein R3F42_04120 [Pseudomonadota bacterium]
MQRGPLTPARILLLALALTVARAPADDGIVQDEPVLAKSLADYANAWWQWTVSMPDSESPVKDRTGARCGVNQAGPVWFLAGGYGSSKIRRSCTIPAGVHVFFPVINMLYYPGNADSELTCAEAKASAALNNQYLRSFKVVVDDHEYVNPVFFRTASESCFDLIARMPGSYNPATVYPAATDGYWVMLKPLRPGSHRIAFRAEYHRPGGAYGSMLQDIEYRIEVKAL